MRTLLRQTVFVALVAALTLAAVPFVNAFAAGANDLTPSSQSVEQIRMDRLERIWAHQLRIYRRMGRVDEVIERVQSLIDRAEANGKDVSPLQEALDAFKAAVKEAQPTYESIKGIVNSHQGFGSNGKVTNLQKAKETVQAMHEKFKGIRETLNGTGKALRQEIRAFRQANPRPQPTLTPTSG